MSTRTLPQSAVTAAAARPSPARQRPFFEALNRVRYGQLVIHAPNGEVLKFIAPEPGPMAHMQLYDWNVLDELVARGEHGLADAYVDGRWDSADLPALITYGLMNTQELEKFFHGRPLYALWIRLRAILQGNSLSGSRRNVMAHYDLGNDFYALWLDKSMTYSCALFEGDASRSLEEAQAAKYRRILGKLDAEPGDHVLEIGCGWGGFAETAARHGLRVTAITLSPGQADYTRGRIARAGLSHLVSVKLVDYREVQGRFDHVVSIGMFEHVGECYWPVYFEKIRDCLREDGRALVQSITLDDRLFESLKHVNGFVEQVIFPGAMLPSKSRFNAAAAKAGLTCHEMYGFGQDYARTLREWLTRFETRRPQVHALGYDDKFIRLWRFYLSSCIASFASHRTDVIQAELTQA